MKKRDLDIAENRPDSDEDDGQDERTRRMVGGGTGDGGGDGVINFTLLAAGKGEFCGTAPAGLTKRGLRRRRSLK